MSICYRIGFENVNGIVSIPEDNSISCLSWSCDELDLALSFCKSINRNLSESEIFSRGYYVVVETPDE